MGESDLRYELTPKEEILSRTGKLQNEMKEKGIDLVLLLQNVDLFYFSGTIQTGCLVIPQGHEAIFFVQKDYQRALKESSV